MSVNPENFDYLRALIQQRSAMVLDDGKEYLVETRLLPVSRRAGLNSVNELVDQLRLADDDGLYQQVVDAMTINETSFFRDEALFELLRCTLFPALIERHRSTRQINIWSAGCSSGQEPYSIAMLMVEHFPELRNWKVQLLASDLSSEILQRACNGMFNQMEVNRGLPAALRDKYFSSNGDNWQLDERIRGMVKFERCNLSDHWPPLEPMDMILMRNVLVYFDLEKKRDVLRRARQVLRADGYLLLGGAETTLQIDDAFQAVHSDGYSYYRLHAEPQSIEQRGRRGPESFSL